jgi:hypothetical protein
VNNQMQLLQYVDMTPVAVGICGTDKSFMFCKYYCNVLLCMSVSTDCSLFAKWRIIPSLAIPIPRFYLWIILQLRLTLIACLVPIAWFLSPLLFQRSAPVMSSSKSNFVKSHLPFGSSKQHFVCTIILFIIYSIILIVILSHLRYYLICHLISSAITLLL